MRVLMIADYLPYPLVGGDRIRIYNLLVRVAARHEVCLAAFLETPEDAAGVEHMQHFCARVETATLQRRSPAAHLPGLLRYTLQGKPPELKFLHSPELAGKIARMAAAHDFDVVQVESRMGLYLEALPPGARAARILMFQNFAAQQYGRAAQVEERWDRSLRLRLNAAAMRRWEPRYAERCGVSTTVSEADRRLLLQAKPRLRVEVIPNGVDVHKYELLPPEADSSDLLFIGNMGYPPCADAAIYFCREVFPLIRQAHGTAQVWLVGRDPPPAVQALACDAVHVTGRVDDVLPYYRRSAVCVVPLRAGGGTRLKILEAMALGRPVVSTSVGCEGLDVADGEHLLVADRPENFARQTVRLLNDCALCARLAAGARRLVVARYDWDVIAGQLLSLYADCDCRRGTRTLVNRSSAWNLPPDRMRGSTCAGRDNPLRSNPSVGLHLARLPAVHVAHRCLQPGSLL